MTFKKQPLNAQYLHKASQEQQPQKLYKINLTSHNISHIETSIKKYNKLRCLILDFNYIEKIINLNPLFDLREFHAEGNMIEKIEGLETCKNLTVLNLAANKIQKIQKIQHLGKLEQLNLSKNKIQKISNLQTLKQLKTVNLSHNCINSLQSLPAFSKLQSLYVSNNKIQKIPNNLFANSLKLTKVDLSHNKLSETTFLSKIVNIQYLNLDHNQLTKFGVEGCLKFLQQLHLQTNQLDQLPLIGQYFPQLVILNINNNMFCSQHQLITVLSGNQMLTEIYFAENPIHTKEFESTLQHLFKFDRINSISYNQPGTKYMSSIKQIEQTFKHQFRNEQDDEEDRKIKMSGFYNDQLENRMSGIKPHRPVSPVTKKAKAIVNDNGQDVEKAFKQFQQNDKKLKSLRQVYQKICSEHNIQKPQINFNQIETEENTYITEQKSSEKDIVGTNPQQQEQRLNELRQRNDNNQKIMKQNKRDKEAKWAELKARTKQKSFNIRKSRTKQAKDMNGSLSKISTELIKQKGTSDLMRTQLNPTTRRPFESAMLTSTGGKTFYRPTSQRKISKKQ